MAVERLHIIINTYLFISDMKEEIIMMCVGAMKLVFYYKEMY